MVCTYGKVWNSIVTVKHKYLLYTANSNKIHSVLTDFMTTGSWSKYITACRRLSTVWNLHDLRWLGYALSVAILYLSKQGCQPKSSQCAITERQFAWYNICSSVNLDSSSSSYFRQSIRLLQTPAWYAAIRFIFLKSNFKKAF